MKYIASPEITSGLISTKKLQVALLAFAMIAISFFSFGQSPEVRQALRLIDIEQPSKGIAALEKLAGTSAENQYYLGLGYLRTGNKDKALAAFEKGISMEEKNGLNYAGKGRVKLIEKNEAEAKANFDKALAVSKSKNAAVLTAVADGYLENSKFVLDAINLLNKARTLNPADPETNLVLGDAYLKQNNGGESVSSYERAASADKKNGKPNFKAAEVYKRSKNTEMVIENLNKSIAADPEYAPAYRKLGEQYYLGKQYDKAVEAAEKYLKLTEDPGTAKYQLAFYYFMAKQKDKSKEIFKEVTSSPDAPAVALKYYARTLVEGDTTKASALEARPIYERYFTKVKPEDIDADDYGYYGKVLAKLKENDLAVQNFEKSIDLDSTQIDILQALGDNYMRQQKFEQAAKAFKQIIALRKQPLSQDLWSLGRAYFFADKYQDADTAFTKLAERQPKVIHGWFWSARSKANIDSTMTQGLAKPAYEKVLEIAGESPEKYKKEMIEAYTYLGAYTVQIIGNVNQAKPYYEKILALDPNNEQAREFFKALNSPASPQKGK